MAWVDLTTTDLERSGRFYGELFGWDITDLGDEAGGYRFGEVAGHAVAGLLAADPDQPIEAWTVYLAVDDVDEAVARAEAAGGHPLVAPYALDEHGRYALLADPGGAVFGLWQASGHSGTQVLAFAGNPAWFENHTKGYDAACAFYHEAFGLEIEPFAADDDFRYSTGRLADSERPAFGIFDVSTGRPKELPSMWAVYFLTADADRDAERAVELGATLTFGPEESVYGRMATLVDPLGAAFNLIEPMAPEPGADEAVAVPDAGEAAVGEAAADDAAADEAVADEAVADEVPDAGTAHDDEGPDDVGAAGDEVFDDADAPEADADAENDGADPADATRPAAAPVDDGPRPVDEGAGGSKPDDAADEADR